jgi:hypothetical protein
MSDLFPELDDPKKKKKDDLFPEVQGGDDLFPEVQDTELFPEAKPSPSSFDVEGGSPTRSPALAATLPAAETTTPTKEMLKAIPGLLGDTLKDAALDTAAAAAYEGAGAVKGVSMGYVDPTKLVDETPLADRNISKGIAEGAGQFAGAIAPIGGIGRGVGVALAKSGLMKGVRPVLQNLVHAGVTGAVYGAARKPEEGETRPENALNDAAGFIVFTGAAQLIDKAARAFAIGKTNAYRALREEVINVFKGKGATDEQAAKMADVGLGEAIRTGGEWADVTASDLRQARRAVRQGQKFILGEQSPEAPTSPAGGPSLPGTEPPGPAGPASSPDAPAPQLSTRIEKDFTPEAQRYLSKFPSLAKATAAGELPMPPDEARELIKKAAAKGEEILLKGGTPAEANLAATAAWAELIKPFAEAGQAPAADLFPELSAPPPAAAATPARVSPTLGDVAGSLGVKPHQMTLDQYGQAYGGEKAPEDVKAAHAEEISKAMREGQNVPPEVLADHGPELGTKVRLDMARDAAHQVLSANGVDDRVMYQFVKNIDIDPARYEATYGKELTPGVKATGETRDVPPGYREDVAAKATPEENAQTLTHLIKFAEGADAGVGRHEAFHVLHQTVLDDAERKILGEEFGSEEDMAEGFARFRAGKETPPDPEVKSIFDKIRQFLERFRNWIKGRKFKTADDILRGMNEGAFKGRAKPAAAAPTGKPKYGLISRFFGETGKAVKPRSPEFFNFMGKSVVREPVFHGTAAEFTAFDPARRELGFHFAADPKIANNRVDVFASRELEDYGYKPGQEFKPGAAVVPAYIRLENPLEMDHDVGEWDNVGDLKYELGPEKKGLFTDGEMAGWRNAGDVRQALEDAGYDGIVYPNQYENSRGMSPEERVSYIVFQPEQIKSQFNAGTFNRETADIRYHAKDNPLKKEKTGPEFEIITPETPVSEIKPGVNQTPATKKKLALFEDTLRSTLFTRPIAFDVKYREQGRLIIPNRKIQGPEDLAYAFRQLKNEMQENFFLGAVKDGRMVAIEHLGFGTIDQVAVYPFETLNLLDTHEADGYFVVHNHPSGHINPSEEDRRLTETIRRVLARNNQKSYGHIIIDDTKFGYLDDNGQFTSMEHKEFKRKKELPVLRKYTEWHEDKDAVMNGPILSNPGTVYEMAKGLQLGANDAMVALMNIQNTMLNAALLPQAALNSGNLQRLAARFRASGLILVKGNLDANKLNQIKNELRDVDVRLLDSVDLTETGFKSALEHGLMENTGSQTGYTAKEAGGGDEALPRYSARDMELPFDGEKPGGEMEPFEETPHRHKAPEFYSPLEQLIDKKVKTKAPAEQILSMIKNDQSMKKDELEWTGIADWLESQKGKSLTRAEVLDYIKAHQAKLEVVVAGGDHQSFDPHDVEIERSEPVPMKTVGYHEGGPNAFPIDNGMSVVQFDVPDAGRAYEAIGNDDKGWNVFDHNGDELGKGANIYEAQALIREHLETVASPEPQWKQYTLKNTDGENRGEVEGSNYREFILKLPSMGEAEGKALAEERARLINKYGDHIRVPEKLNEEAWGRYQDYGEQLAKLHGDDIIAKMTPAEKAKLDRLREAAENASYENRSHYPGQKGLVGHIRATDETIGGESTLFVQEFQSDFFQKVRAAKKGDFDNLIRRGFTEEQARALASGFRREGPDGEKYRELDAEQDALHKKLNELNDKAAPLEDRLDNMRRRLMKHNDITYRDEFAESPTGKKFRAHEEKKLGEIAKQRREMEGRMQALSDAKDKLDVGNMSHFAKAPWANSWHELLFKYILRQAVEEGYTSLSWTTGKQQEQRWHESEFYGKLYDEMMVQFANKYLKKWNGKVEDGDLDDVGGGEGEYAYNVVDSDGDVVETFQSEREAERWINDNEPYWSTSDNTEHYVYDVESGDIFEDSRETGDDYTARKFLKDLRKQWSVKSGWAYRWKNAEGKWVGVYDDKAKAKRMAAGKPITREYVHTVLDQDGEQVDSFDNLEEAEAALEKKFTDRFSIGEDETWEVRDPDGETIKDGFDSEREAQSYIDNHYESPYSVSEDERSGDVEATVHVVKITPEMREAILYQGQSLYRAGDVRKNIDRTLLPSRRQDPKIYTEKMALRRALQQQAIAAGRADTAARDKIAEVQKQLSADIERMLPETERGYFLTRIAKVQDPEAALKLIKQVQKRMMKVAARGERAITEKDALERSLQRQAAAAKDAAKAASEAIGGIQKTITDAIKAHLPVEERGQFVDMIRNARSMKDVILARERIVNALEKSQRKTLIKSIKREIQRVQASQAIAIDYRAKVKELMNDILFQRPMAKTLASALSLQRYIDTQRAAGKDVTVPQYVLDRLNNLTGTPLADFDTGTLENALNDIRTLAELGRQKWKSMQEIDNFEKKNALRDLAHSTLPITQARQTQAFPGEALPISEGLRNLFRSALNVGQHIQWALMPIDVGFDLLDGLQDYKGANTRIFKATADRGFGKWLTETAKVKKDTIALAKKLGLKTPNMDRIGLYAAAVQEDGLAKLYNNFGVNPEPRNAEEKAWKEAIDAKIKAVKLTPPERVFYNHMRKVLDETLPRIKEVMRVVYNVDVGSLKNYFPFMTDYKLMGEDEIQARTLQQMMGMKKNVQKGFTEKRVGAGNQKINIDALDVFVRHMDDALYLIHMGPITKRLGEIANSEAYGSMAGDVGARFVREWVDVMARKGGTVGGQQLQILDILRVNVGTATLGFKLSSALIQFTPIIEAATLIGHYAFKGAAFYATNRNWRRFIDENMPELANRSGDDPAYSEFIGRRGKGVLKNLSRGLDSARAAGFWALKTLDEWAANSVAAGAYMKWLADNGYDPIKVGDPNKVIYPEGLEYAQRIVRRTQSSGYFKDSPLALTRGRLSGNRQIDRALLQFQSFVVNQFSLLTHEGMRYGFAGQLPPPPPTGQLPGPNAPAQQPRFRKANKGRVVSVWFWTILAILAGQGVRMGVQKTKDAYTGRRRKDQGSTLDQLESGSVQELLSRVPFTSNVLGLLSYGNAPIPALDAIMKLGEAAQDLRRSKNPTPRAKAKLKMAAAGARILGVPGTAEAESVLRDKLGAKKSGSGTMLSLSGGGLKKSKLKKTQALR